jgi:hypothetical protein
MMDWKCFVNALGQHADKLGDVVPLRLQKQIDQKYTDGHRLQTLLESHQDALCQEPRDKIYGFVGLATDCIEGYPMDYQKSLYEVWKDAMMFKGSLNDNEFDTMVFGTLLSELLGNFIVTPEEVTEDINSRVQKLVKGSNISIKYLQPTTLTIPSRLVGRICFIGPTYDEILSNLTKTAQWRASINRYLEGRHRVSAREESEYFLEMLEEAEQDDLRIVSSYDNDVIWSIPHTSHRISRLEDDVQIEADGIMEFDSGSPSSSPSLFLLGGLDYAITNACGKMGLVSPKARVGDFICQIHGIKRAIVVRRDDLTMRVIGTGAMAQNHSKARAARDAVEQPKKEFDRANFAENHVGNADRLDLYLDVGLAYQLLD